MPPPKMAMSTGVVVCCGASVMQSDPFLSHRLNIRPVRRAVGCGRYGSIAALPTRRRRIDLMRTLYSGLWYALMPALFIRLWWRGRRAPAYRGRWRERLALGLPRQPGHTVWIHAVSVGETLAAAPMIRELLCRHPATPLVVTTTTPTGSEQVRKLFGDSV